jgi:hypothetical protein
MFQQNIARFNIGLVVIVTVNLRLKTILAARDQIREGLAAVSVGEVISVQVPVESGME